MRWVVAQDAALCEVCAGQMGFLDLASDDLICPVCRIRDSLESRLTSFDEKFAEVLEIIVQIKALTVPA